LVEAADGLPFAADEPAEWDEALVEAEAFTAVTAVATAHRLTSTTPVRFKIRGMTLVVLSLRIAA
jgi:hypothetical protein